MIVAAGFDLVHLPQLQAVLDRRGERFLDRVLTAGEKEYCTRRRRCVESVAARFAAKEAVMKALGTGWGGGVTWREIEVVREGGGAPSLRLHGGTARLAAERGIGRWLVTLTHSGEYAAAWVLALAGP